MRPNVLCWQLVWLCLASCECEKGPCEATQKPQRARVIEQGVIGVVAYETDACDANCCECSWSEAQLTLWSAAEPFRDREAVLARLAQGAPTERFSVEADYEHALLPGHYLLCEMNACAALSIDRSVVFTVNLQQVFGPTQLVVFASGEQRPDLVFDELDAALMTDEP
ncbi:MAG TPA: hypothetical protein VJR89_26890 [Polyangiales bacterium]|nr:hypothetical protein [Polyangiales bacterium]